MYENSTSSQNTVTETTAQRFVQFTPVNPSGGDDGFTSFILMLADRHHYRFITIILIIIIRHQSSQKQPFQLLFVPRLDRKWRIYTGTEVVDEPVKLGEQGLLLML